MRIREVRISKNVSQKDLAIAVNISQTALCNYEKGNREPRIETLILISEALDCTIDELVKGEKENGIN